MLRPPTSHPLAESRSARVAEGVGFEPTVPVKGRRFSRPTTTETPSHDQTPRDPLPTYFSDNYAAPSEALEICAEPEVSRRLEKFWRSPQEEVALPSQPNTQQAPLAVTAVLQWRRRLRTELVSLRDSLSAERLLSPDALHRGMESPWPRIQNDVFELFLEEPDREFHVREVAGLARCSPSTAVKYLRVLTGADLLVSYTTRGRLIFRANSERRSFRLKKSFYNVDRVRECGLIDFLEATYRHPEAIVLLGDFARGGEDPGNVIRIAVVTPARRIVATEGFERCLGRTITVVEVAPKMIALESDKALLNQLANGSTVSGFLELIR